MKPEKPVKPNNEEKPRKDHDNSQPSGVRKVTLLAMPVLGFFMITLVWSEVYKPDVMDDWYRGIRLVDSATKSPDTIIGKQLMDEGGNILREQIRLHPYHARVWFLYGYYLNETGKWDSCILAEKEALRIGAGGTVNRIDFMAADVLNRAVNQKLLGIGRLDSAMAVINGAFTPGYENTWLMKKKAFTFYNFKQYDSCIPYLERYNSKVTGDFEALKILAYSFTMERNFDTALIYANKSANLKKNDPEIARLLEYLNTRKKP